MRNKLSLILFTIFIFSLATSADESVNDNERQKRDVLVGAPAEKSPEELTTILQESINSIPTGSGNKIEIINVKSGNTQLVAGLLTTIKADLKINEKTYDCSVKIWQKAWLVTDNTKTTIECKDLHKIEFRHQSNRIAKRSVGSETDTSIQDSFDILDDHLKSLAAGEGPTYKLIKVNDAKVQTVSGHLLKINADVSKDDTNVITCYFEIWTRKWLKEDNSELTFDCDENTKTFKLTSNIGQFDHRNVAEKKDQKKSTGYNFDKTEHLFQKYQQKYGKTYDTITEKQIRLNIFRRNLELIDNLNRYELGTAKYGVTEFADLTYAEYKLRTGLIRDQGDANHIPNPVAEIPNVELPPQFDWRDRNVISQVKNQGQCGSCWAFSVIGNIEGLHAVKTGKLEEYSEQELVDCDTVDQACNGGDMDKAFAQIEKIGGLELENDYPYKAKKQQCHFQKDLVHVKVKGAVDLPKNETAMAQWLVSNGPISIGINANAMQFYRGGISHPWKLLCKSSSLDHGVLIVGYGVADYPRLNKTLPYWIVKNSWGNRWGEQGYYRVYRGDNTCGVREMACSAVLAD